MGSELRTEKNGGSLARFAPLSASLICALALASLAFSLACFEKERGGHGHLLVVTMKIVYWPLTI